MKNKVSIIIPTYNRKNFIKKAIESVLSQSFQNIEIIVVDDGSSDGTYEYIKNNFKKVRLFHTENKGVSSARNLGIQKSSGNYVAFLDSDDEWDRNKLEIQLKYFQNNPQIYISHTDEEWIRNGKRVNKPKKYSKKGGDVFFDCLPLTKIGASTVIVKKKIFDIIGYFDETMPVCEDYDLWLRIASKYNYGFIDKKLTIKFAGHNDQLSTTIPFQNKWRIYSIIKLLNTSLPENYKKAATAELLKKCKIMLIGVEKKGLHKEKNYYSDIINKYKDK